MKSNYLVLSITILLISVNKLCAQDQFPDENVDQKWEYVTWYFWGGQCEARAIKTTGIVEKCGVNYIEVVDCDESENNCRILGYYRIQGDSVLVRTNYPYLNGVMDTVVCDETEGLMYDFSTIDSDTMICQINSTWPSTFTKFWEIDKEQIEYEGIERQTTTLNYIPNPNAPNFLYQMNWIEVIGSNIHPFYSFTCIGDHCELEQKTTKVTRNGQVIFQDTILNFSFPCTGWITSTNDEVSATKFLSLFPNPTSRYIIIKSEEISNISVKYVIYDVQGKVQLKSDQYELGNLIDIEHLNSGIYIIQVLDGKQVQNLKLIKE